MSEAVPSVESIGAAQPRPIAQRSVVELVIAEIRRLILEGILPAGSAVSIKDLSSRLEVSHIPIREALRRLEGEGLIELRHARSAVVAQLSVEDLEQVFHLRSLLESDIMARAVKLYTDEDITSIEHAWQGLERLPDDTTEALSARHVEFHRRLYTPAMSDWDRRVGEILWQASDRYVYLILGTPIVMDDPTHFRDAHSELLEAACARSPRLARKATIEHNRRGIELVSSQLRAGARRSARRRDQR